MFIVSLRLFSENKKDGQQSITLHRPSILNFIHFKILSYILKPSSLQTLKTTRILLPVSASHLRTISTAISAARRFWNINTPVEMQQNAMLFRPFCAAKFRQKVPILQIRMPIEHHQRAFPLVVAWTPLLYGKVISRTEAIPIPKDGRRPLSCLCTQTQFSLRLSQ